MQKNNYIHRIGYSLLASLFFISGILKVIDFEKTLAYMTKLGLPLPMLAVLGTIFIEIIGGFMIIANIKVRFVCFILAAFTLAATLAGHRFWEVDPAMFSSQLNNFLKNIAIIGGLLMLADKKE